jgi:hypothetical protein
MRGTRIALLCSFLAVSMPAAFGLASSAQPRSAQRANDWYHQQPFLVGSNFIPSTAMNQLQVWQADTFDLPTNVDSVWDPDPKLGRQPEPRPHVHNSRWMQSPGRAMLRRSRRSDQELRTYVEGVIARFRDDRWVLMWDLMNQPDNDNPRSQGTELKQKAQLSLALLKREWTWARRMEPSQPLTSRISKDNWWRDDQRSAMARFQRNSSGVITFHSYGPLREMRSRIESLQRFGRPMICTECMARPTGSKFQTILPILKPILKEARVGAYNWGLVSGKPQTIDPWDSWEKHFAAEPPVWFLDIFRQDGTPYDPREVAVIRQLTRKEGSSQK